MTGALSDPFVAFPLVLSAALYLAGLARLWRKAGVGHGVRLRQAGLFALGWGVLALALASPLHALAEELFVAHMIEHELMMVVAAPLIVLARPLGAFAWALPLRWGKVLAELGRSTPVAMLWAWISAPISATILHGLALWLWHAPALFEAALASEPVHRIQHASFLLSGLIFWWALLREGARGYGVASLHLFVTSIHAGLLGALLTLAPRPLYPHAHPSHWGLSPIEDQQLAGLIMWVPACAIYVVAALALLALWLSRLGQVHRGPVFPSSGP